MAIVWIGDFRCRSLQCAYTLSKKVEIDHEYIIEDFGGVDWFGSHAMYQLEKLCPVSSHIVVMSGLIDCVKSCIWKNIDIDTVVKNYKTALEKLKNNYNGHLFYFCSVPQVDGDYPSSAAKSGIVTAETLNKKIKAFNSKMEEDCPVTFIDCYDYIAKTGLNTRDGLRYTHVAAKALQEYVTSKVTIYSITVSNTFMSFLRDSNDKAPTSQDESWRYWTSECNSCIDIPDNSGSGVKIPNCTGYAWGRFYEITGEKPKLSTNNASVWYSNTSDGYDRGSEPLPGAVICWTDGGAGHVAIVEKVNSDGSILISQSYYRNAYYDPTNTDHFSTQTLTNSDGNWGWAWQGYEFQGFIYCPQTTKVNDTTNTSSDTNSTTNTTRSTTNSTTGINAGLCVENSYGITKEQMEPNAQYIWQYFGSRGWSKNAVAAMLGNIEQESKMSPCVWEGCINGSNIDSSTGKHSLNTSVLSGFGGGYGLTQWTPYSKYTNWCANKGLNYWDINSQLQRIEAELAASEVGGWSDEDQWITVSEYDDITFKEFTTSEKDVEWLALAFCDSYERAGSPDYTARKENATYWYNFLSGLSTTLIGSTTVSNQLRLFAFKVDTKTSTKAKLSFVANNSTSCSYTLKQDETIIETKSGTFKGGIKTFTIKNLKPKTKYTVTLEVLGANDTKETKDVTFTTLQDYPGAAKEIFLDLKLTNGFKDANNNFKLSITKPDSLGYWKNNSNGYELGLYINGNCIKTKTINTVTNISSSDFDIEKEFGYKCKIGDTVQIGVRTWVKTDTGKTIYDSTTFKTSQAFCLLNNPIRSYLNLKNATNKK